MARHQAFEAGEQLVALGGTDLQPRAIDIGDPPIRLGQLDVAAGLARHADEFVGKAPRGEQLLERLRIGFAEKAGHGQLMAEIGQDLGDVEPLARSVHLQVVAAIDFAQAQRGQLHGEIQRGIEGDGQYARHQQCSPTKARTSWAPGNIRAC